MSVHFISGVPRGGKSLYAVRLIVEELVYGSRVVVTNVPLKLGRLNEYLQEKYGDAAPDLHKRVRILTDDETREFWRYRGEGLKGPERLTKEEWRDGKRPDYSWVTDAGVYYCIDEVHNFYNAREWMETGRDALNYLSQHAKLGDTVICITQCINNVDKQFRSVTQDFTYVRNLSKERMGMFRLPAIFMRSTYLQPKTGAQSAAMTTGTFRLDVSGLASCYDTAAGVGIHGTVADRNEKPKGPSWMWAVGGLVVLVCLVGWGLPKLVGGIFSSAASVSTKLADFTSSKPVEEARQRAAETNKEIAIVSRVDRPPVESNGLVRIVGFTRFRDNVEWRLSDGRTIRPADKLFAGGNASELHLQDGTVYRK